MARAINDPWWLNAGLAMEAEGYQFDRAGAVQTVADPNPDPARRSALPIVLRNGGLIRKRRVELAEDNRMFRFAARRYLGLGAPGLLPLLNSPWWMEEERMVLLLGRAREAGVPLVEMARRQLALPADWTDCDIIVSVRPLPGILLAAHAGPGLTAESSGERRIIAHEAPHLFMDQLYVPGLGRHPALAGQGAANAAAWFQSARATSYDPAARGFNP